MDYGESEKVALKRNKMLEFLKEFKNEEYDLIFFLPGDEEGDLQVEGACYKNPGKKVEGSQMGDLYHIILFKEDFEQDKIYDVDRFEAILGEPLEYISGLIPSNWFGMIAKKTTTSEAFVQKIFDKMQEV